MMEPIVVRWPGGEHAFRLGFGELAVIQQKTECGPEWLFHRIANGQWNYTDLIEVLRNGLIGGGMEHVAALNLVNKTFELHPLYAFKAPAVKVLGHRLFGPTDDPVGEPLPVGPTPATNNPTENGSSVAT